MKTLTTAVTIALFASNLWAGSITPLTQPLASPDIPERFSTFKTTEVMEWGCPVSDLVQASTSHDAIEQITNECVDEVVKQATLRENVFEVIRVNVVWPDVSVTEEAKGFRLTGTFFLETYVLQGAGK